MNNLNGIAISVNKYLPRTVLNRDGDEVELLGVMVGQGELEESLLEPVEMLDGLPLAVRRRRSKPIILLTGDVVTPANKEPRE